LFTQKIITTEAEPFSIKVANWRLSALTQGVWAPNSAAVGLFLPLIAKPQSNLFFRCCGQCQLFRLYGLQQQYQDRCKGHKPYLHQLDSVIADLLK
jgi:hypothetical protein